MGNILLSCKNLKWVYYVACLAVVLLLSTVRSSPVYGKLDFFLLDSRPWWPAWRELVESCKGKGVQQIYSDPLTNVVLWGAFNFPVYSDRTLVRRPLVSIEELDERSAADEKLCLINLQGFVPSWVAAETHHWQANLADTLWFYKFSGKTGPAMVKDLQENPPEHCEIFH